MINVKKFTFTKNNIFLARPFSENLLYELVVASNVCVDLKCNPSE